MDEMLLLAAVVLLGGESEPRGESELVEPALLMSAVRAAIITEQAASSVAAAYDSVVAVLVDLVQRLFGRD